MQTNDVINQLREQVAELQAQLVEVKKTGGTGQSPCARFCESVALSKDLKRISRERGALAAQLSGVMDELGDFCAALDGMLLADLGADEICDDLENRMSHYKNDSAKFIAAHDAEVAAKAVLEFAAKLLVNQKVDVIDCAKTEADQLRAKAGKE